MRILLLLGIESGQTIIIWCTINPTWPYKTIFSITFSPAFNPKWQTQYYWFTSEAQRRSDGRLFTKERRNHLFKAIHRLFFVYLKWNVREAKIKWGKIPSENVEQLPAAQKQKKIKIISVIIINDFDFYHTTHIFIYFIFFMWGCWSL